MPSLPGDQAPAGVLRQPSAERDRQVRFLLPTDYEWLFVVCGDACAYLIPTDAISARTQISLGKNYDAYLLHDDESG
jgi:hypothetical protein